MQRRTFLTSLLLPALSRGSVPPTVAGRWRSVTTTKGGIGAVYDFRPNGTGSYSSAALVDLPYQLTGDQLTLGPDAIGIGWHKDGRLQFNYGKGRLEDFARLGKTVDPAKPLLGDWSRSQIMAGRSVPVILQFREGGSALYAVLIKTQAGRLAGSGPWTMTLANLPEREIAHDAGSGQLTITVKQGDPHRFERF
jgi:hypothetical protein